MGTPRGACRCGDVCKWTCTCEECSAWCRHRPCYNPLRRGCGRLSCVACAPPAGLARSTWPPVAPCPATAAAPAEEETSCEPYPYWWPTATQETPPRRRRAPPNDDGFVYPPCMPASSIVADSASLAMVRFRHTEGWGDPEDALWEREKLRTKLRLGEGRRRGGAHANPAVTADASATDMVPRVADAPPCPGTSSVSTSVCGAGVGGAASCPACRQRWCYTGVASGRVSDVRASALEIADQFLARWGLVDH